MAYEMTLHDIMTMWCDDVDVEYEDGQIVIEWRGERFVASIHAFRRAAAKDDD